MTRINSSSPEEFGKRDVVSETSSPVAERSKEFSADEIRVIRERRFGWEGASCKLLAAVFQTTPQHIAKICAQEHSS